MTSALLALENGRVYRGRAIGAAGTSLGEIVFNTSMTGYQEILSDPSYAGQIVVMTAPQIGNTGVNEVDNESATPHARGFVVREMSPLTSSWRAEDSLAAYLTRHNIVGIDGLDTRAITRSLRQGGAQRAGITTELSEKELLAAVSDSPHMEGLDLATGVSCREAYDNDQVPWVAEGVSLDEPLPQVKFRVVALDFGIKRNILRQLRRVGCAVTVVPAKTTAEEILALKPDGVFLSNGPGDPAAVTQGVKTVQSLLGEKLPLFGICLGHQILALALGAKTYKLPFGHHGGNHPVRDESSRKVEITAQNHGFAVTADSLPESASASHINLYDNTVAGLDCPSLNCFGIQYHPEAGPGPHDARYLFSQFVESMSARQ